MNDIRGIELYCKYTDCGIPVKVAGFVEVHCVIAALSYIQMTALIYILHIQN